MAKTYNTFSNVSTGDPLPATTFNNLLTNVANYRVPPMCRMSRITSQSINNDTDTRIEYGTSVFDTDGMVTTGSGAKITIQTAGIYQVSFYVNFASVAAQFVRQAWANVTPFGGSAYRSIPCGFTLTTGGIAFGGSEPMSLTAGSTIEGYCYHLRGSAMNIENFSTAPASVLAAVWVGQAS